MMGRPNCACVRSGFPRCSGKSQCQAVYRASAHVITCLVCGMLLNEGKRNGRPKPKRLFQPSIQSSFKTSYHLQLRPEASDERALLLSLWNSSCISSCFQQLKERDHE